MCQESKLNTSLWTEDHVSVWCLEIGGVVTIVCICLAGCCSMWLFLSLARTLYLHLLTNPTRSPPYLNLTNPNQKSTLFKLPDQCNRCSMYLTLWTILTRWSLCLKPPDQYNQMFNVLNPMDHSNQMITVLKTSWPIQSDIHGTYAPPPNQSKRLWCTCWCEAK